jgi:hypothetical protein
MGVPGVLLSPPTSFIFQGACTAPGRYILRGVRPGLVDRVQCWLINRTRFCRINWVLLSLITFPKRGRKQRFACQQPSAPLSKAFLRTQQLSACARLRGCMRQYSGDR